MKQIQSKDNLCLSDRTPECIIILFSYIQQKVLFDVPGLKQTVDLNVIFILGLLAHQIH